MVTANDLLCEIIFTFNLVLFDSPRVLVLESYGPHSAYRSKDTDYYDVLCRVMFVLHMGIQDSGVK